MKNIISLFLLIVISVSLTAISDQKIVTGVLKKDLSPYYVTQNWIVPKDSTLVIEKGVTLFFQSNYSINVKGKIIAEGTKNDSIYFTSLKNSGWNGVYLYQSVKKDTSLFSYCNFSKANTHNPAYKVEKSAVTVNHYNFVKISNCSFYENKANYGGAISIFGSTITIENCDFKKNYSGFLGGALVVSANSTVKIFNSIFEQNTSDYYAGAIYIDKQSYLTLINVLIDRNGATTGGAIVVKSALLGLINSTITANNANYSGGLDISEKSDITIINTILWGNVSGESDNLKVDESSSVEIKNSIIERQDIAESLDNVHYENLIFENPKFSLTDRNQFALSNDSPAIDKGRFDFIKNIIPKTDLNGNKRLVGKNIDIGAFERNDKNNPKIGGYRLFFLKYDLNREKFEGIIKFKVNKTKPLLIKIYNPEIKLINTIKISNPKSGENVVVWDGKSMNNKQMEPGIYFFKAVEINN